MQNPYTPPETSVDKEAMTWAEMGYSPKMPMIVSAAVLSVLVIVDTVNDYSIEQRYGLVAALANFVVGILYACYSVYLMNAMANGPGANGKIKAFTWWGLLWRTFLAHLLILIPLIIINFTIFGRYSEQSFQMSLVMTVSSVVMMPVIIWITFSNNRRAQYERLIFIIAGA